MSIEEHKRSSAAVESGLRRAIQERLSRSDPRQRAILLDRYVGCLLGGAVGDALGAPVEFMSREAIHRAYGEAGIREYVAAYGRLGAITDDTQMALFTAEGLLRAWVRKCMRGIGPVFASVTDRAYGRWLTTQGESPGFETPLVESTNGWLITHQELFARRAPGLTCLAALRSKAKVGEPANNSSKGCGGVMRVAPVGLLCASLKPGQNQEERDDITFDLGCEIAGLTHGHPTGRHPAGYLSVLIAGLADGRPWAEAHTRARRPLAAASSSSETIALLDEAIRLADIRPCAPDSVASLGQGWVAEEALAISVYCAASGLNRFRHGPTAFEEALVLAVNHDGDSDSTGAITGNVIGTALGQGCICERWRRPLELHDVICEMAEDLATVIVWEVGEYDDSEECEYWWRRYPGA